MNRLILCVWVLLLFSAADLTAQSILNRLEFGVSAQALSDYADLNPEVNPNTNERAPGVFSQLDIAPAVVVRYNLPYRFALRGSYSVTQELVKAGLIGEFHFNDYNAYEPITAVTPYLGIGAAYNQAIESREAGISALMAFGAKKKHKRLTVSAEFAAGVRLPSENKSLLNDWYVFPNLSITYTFGPNF
jgi:hypothetical protein